MNLDDIDKLIKDREERVQKRKGNLYENEVELENKRLKESQQPSSLPEGTESPPCPHCGVIMEVVPEERMIVCKTCGIGSKY